MPHAVTDTHALIWYLRDDQRLSPAASALFEACAQDGESIWVPSICAVEIIYLAEKGRIPPDMLQSFIDGMAAPGTVLKLAGLDLSTVQALTTIPRAAVPDMPDRIIAATAVSLGFPLISRDGRIRASGIATVW